MKILKAIKLIMAAIIKTLKPHLGKVSKKTIFLGVVAFVKRALFVTKDIAIDAAVEKIKEEYLEPLHRSQENFNRVHNLPNTDYAAVLTDEVILNPIAMGTDLLVRLRGRYADIAEAKEFQKENTIDNADITDALTDEEVKFMDREIERKAAIKELEEKRIAEGGYYPTNNYEFA